jgi:peptide/nickel transport system substrate-binding protein
MSYKTKKLVTVSVVLGLLIVIGATIDSALGAQQLAEKQEVALAVSAGDIGSADPVGSGLVQDKVLVWHIFGSLVRYPIGEVASGKIEPSLATKWELSPDKSTWTFHLRKGVQWHWGYGEFTSEDVVYSFNRVKNSKASAWRGSYENFKEVKAVDKYTVQITTFKPDPYLLTNVSDSFGGYIVCKKAVEKAGALDRALGHTKEEVVGTGPFKFLEYRPKDRIVLVGNSDYWEGKPIIEKLTIKFIPNNTAREIAIFKAEVHGYSGTANQQWLKHMRSKGIIAQPMGPGDLKAIYFNLRVKPFDNKKVREAFAYACSQESIAEMQGHDISRAATSPVPSGLWGHIDAGWHRKRDVKKAKKLLAEAGYPDGLRVKCFMSVGWWYMDKMIIWQNELKEAGIDLQMTKIDHTVYKQKIRAGLNPFAIWGMTQPLATYWLRNFYHTDSAIDKPKGNHNFMYYSNPEVDSLIERAETAMDEKVRLDAIGKAQRIIVEDLPSIPVIETRTPKMIQPVLDLGYKPKSNFLYNLQIGPKTKLLKR